VLKLIEGSEPLAVARLPAEAVVRCLLEERNGTLWVGTAASGLFRLQGKEFAPVAVSHPEISAMMQDVEGNLWVGTAGGGLDLLRPRAVQMVTTKSGLPFDSVRSVCEDAEGWMWAALQDGSLARCRGGQWEAVTSAAGWPGGHATCVVPGRAGGVWIGTRDRGLQRLHGGKIEEWPLPEGQGSRAVRSLLAASNGELWIATDSPSRLLVLREGGFRSLTLPGGLRSMRALAEDADGTIWVGTSDGQVLHVTGSAVVNETQELEEQSLSVRCLHAAADGSLLIGYAGWGIGRKHNGKYKRIGATGGLYDEYVAQILSDGKGGLWLTGNRGLFQVRLDELVAVAEGRETRVHSIAYGRNEGLPNFQAVFDNSPSAWRGADGRLWFCTRNGLLVVSPGQVRANESPPPVLLTQVKVDDQLIALRDSHWPLRAGVESSAKDLNQPGLNLALAPGHGKIEFEFTALSFNSPENVHFRHRLKGFDTEWVEIGPQRTAKYPRLPAGGYEFEVTACNEAGVWSEAGFRLPFVVEPFFWQTWWFRGLLVVTFTAGVAATVRYVSFRRLRRQMARLEQQAALDKERGRIAKDLHDDLGASMTQMTLLLELALQQKSTPAAVLDHVEDGLRAGREAIKSLDAAVWAVNPANNTLPELVAYIGQFGMEFLQQAGIRCVLELPDQPPERPVSAELRHNLFLIVKEALNNIVRHARASTVRLQMTITPATLEMLIEDDGCGIEREPQDGLADGLRNMRQRAEELKAEFRIESRPGGGTRLTFLYPWPAVPE
jgi:signal transduction histidine kinase